MSEKTLTDKQELFLAALFGEAKGNATEAKRIAGYSENTRVTDITKGLENEIMDRARKLLSQSTAQAVFTMLDAMTNDFEIGIKEKMAAAKDVLDRAGVVKREQIEVTAKEPVFILPAKREDD